MPDNTIATWNYSEDLQVEARVALGGMYTHRLGWELGVAIMLVAHQQSAWDWLYDNRRMHESVQRFVKMSAKWMEMAEKASWSPARQGWGHEPKQDVTDFVRELQWDRAYSFNPIGEVWQIYEDAEKTERARETFMEVYHALCEFDANGRCDHLK